VPDAKPFVAGIRAQAARDGHVQVEPRDADVRTDAQLARVAHTLERGEGEAVAERIERLDPGDAALPRLALPETDRRDHVVVRGERHGRVREHVRVLLKDPGGLAPRIAEDRTTLGRGGVAPDPRATQRFAVQPARMPVAAPERGRSSTGDAIQLGRGRPAAPDVLVEAPPEDPCVLGQTSRVGLRPRERLVDRLRFAQVKLSHLHRPPHEVDVRVGPARHHEPAAKVDALRAIRFACELARIAEGNDATVAREERLDRSPVADVHASAMEELRRHENPPGPRSGTKRTAPWRRSRPPASRTTSSWSSSSPIGATTLPSGASCASNAGSMPGLAAVTRTRSYGAASGYPRDASAWITRTFA
jgi:hypothetical protein